MKKHIFLITWHGGAGGLSKMVYEIARSLKCSDTLDISVGYAKEGGVYCDEISKMGIPVFIFGMKSGFDAVSAARITLFIKRMKFDVVHLFYVVPLLKIAVFLANRNIIITEQCGVVSYKKKRLWPIYRLVSILTNRIGRVYITVSTHSRDDLVKHNFYYRPDEIVIIPNGVDINVFSRQNTEPDREILSGGRKVVGIVKALTAEHGIDHFVEMARHLSLRRNDVRFVIVGDGPEHANLLEMARGYGIEKDFCFTGVRTDTPRIISSFDIAVLPSRNETFGIFALEAMALEVPVVAYAVGGLPEVIAGGETGILVRGRDPAKLADAVNSLLDDGAKRREMGLKGRKRVEALFDISKVIPRYVEFYKKV